MSLLTKIMMILSPPLVYTLMRMIFRVLRLSDYTKIRVIDLFTLFLIYALDTFAKAATGFSLFFYYAMMVSAMALVFLLLDLFYFQKFTFPAFFRRWWRSTYLVTLIMYLCLILAVLFFP